MTMNKREQQAFKDMQHELALAKALRFTDKVEPDVAIPGSFGRLATGFLYNAYISNPRVDAACTSSVSHAFGDNTKTSTQNARRLYSTRLLALRAMRHDLEKQCAEILARVDEDIARELKDDGIDQ